MQVVYAHKPALTLIGFPTTIAPEEGYVKCRKGWSCTPSRKATRQCFPQRDRSQIPCRA